MDHFFVDTGPGVTGGPDRYGRPDAPASAEATGTAAPAENPDRLPRLRPAGEGPSGDRRPRRAGRPGEPGLASAMRYLAGEQRVESGAALRLDVSEIHGDCAAPSGDGGLYLLPGQYLLSFCADAAGERGQGAVFVLNGAPLPFTGSLIPGPDPGRLALTAVLALTGAAVLTVENNCAGEVRYRNALLTAVRLS